MTAEPWLRAAEIIAAEGRRADAAEADLAYLLGLLKDLSENRDDRIREGREARAESRRLREALRLAYAALTAPETTIGSWYADPETGVLPVVRTALAQDVAL